MHLSYTGTKGGDLLHYHKPPIDLSSPYWGLAEVAYFLGWDRRKVALYRDRGVFPEPVYTLRATPLWLAADIQAYANPH